MCGFERISRELIDERKQAIRTGQAASTRVQITSCFTEGRISGGFCSLSCLPLCGQAALTKSTYCIHAFKFNSNSFLLHNTPGISPLFMETQKWVKQT